jgi:hypothetical protein
MSNQAVGSVYQTIIEEVINSSRVDFEENGIEESVLEELRQVSINFFFASPGSFIFCEARHRGRKVEYPKELRAALIAGTATSAC